MVKRHMKRLSAPKFWQVKKKETKYVTRPRPGPHKLDECIPLQILVRNILGLVDTGSDAKRMIKSGEILVDGKSRKDHKYSVGLMDVISIPKMKKNYRISIDYKGLKVIECPDKESKTKLVRIEDKTLIEKGNVQLNLHDGRNLIVQVKNPKKPTEDVYKTGDTLIIELPSQKILDHFKFEKGNYGLLTDGQNKGVFTKIKQIIETRSREPNKVICEKEGKDFEAIKDYVFIIGKTKPVITLEGK